MPAATSMLTEPTLLAELRDTGCWWIPEQPDRRVWGELHFDPRRGPRLNLLEALSSSDSSEPMSYPVIHGELSRGDVTVLESQSSGMPPLPRPFRRGPDNERLISKYVIFGHHVNTDTRFASSQFRFDNLDMWTHSELPFDIHRDHSLIESIIIDRQPNENFRLGEAKCSIDYNIDVEFGWLRIPHCSLKSRSSFVLSFQKAKTLEEHIRHVIIFQHLIALLSMDVTFIESIKLSFDDIKQAPSNVTLLLFGQTPSIFERDVDFDQPFRLSELNISDLTRKWLEIYSIVEWSVRRLYVAQHAEGLYSDVRFLIAMQALEHLHSQLQDFEYVSSDEYECVKKCLIDAIPQNIDSRLTSRVVESLKYCNRPSLRHRLVNVRESTRSLQAPVDILNKQIIRRLVNARNYLTHGSERKPVRGGREYLELCRIVVVVSMAVLLERLGLPPEVVAKKLHRERRVSRFLL
jgi:ApeA N-terminal domain 1/Apea-like HEPN